MFIKELKMGYEYSPYHKSKNLQNLARIFSLNKTAILFPLSFLLMNRALTITIAYIANNNKVTK